MPKLRRSDSLAAVLIRMPSSMNGKTTDGDIQWLPAGTIRSGAQVPISATDQARAVFTAGPKRRKRAKARTRPSDTRISRFNGLPATVGAKR
jgi:hypothetical protein